MSLTRPPDNATKSHARPEALGIPTHPRHIMPRRMDLWAGYERALVEIEHNRRRQLRADNYAQEARHGAFSAFLRALSNSCSAIVAEAHPNARQESRRARGRSLATKSQRLIAERGRKAVCTSSTLPVIAFTTRKRP
jgi:hypothetical protein